MDRLDDGFFRAQIRFGDQIDVALVIRSFDFPQKRAKNPAAVIGSADSNRFDAFKIHIVSFAYMPFPGDVNLFVAVQ